MPTTDSNIAATEVVFHLEFMDEQKRLVCDEPLRRADFEHAINATRFEALLARQTSKYVADPQAARIVPLFADGQNDSPWTTGFRVLVRLPSGAEHSRDFGIGYFSSRASRVRARLIRAQQLGAEQEVLYRLTAYHDDHPEFGDSRLPISLEPPTFQVQVRPGRQADYGRSEAWDKPDGRVMPVVVDRSVLEETVAEARAAPLREVGGLLLGHFMHDQQNGTIFLAVTGLAPGGDTTEGSQASVTFTPETFARARQIMEMRGDGERIVGWYHSHPFCFCAECPLPTPPECIAKVLFYSQDDIHLMETTFAQPFMVGLLAAVEPRIEAALGHLPVRLYGWRDGTVQQRGFEVVDVPLEAESCQ